MKKQNTNSTDSTQRAIGPTLLIGQIIGLLPVMNITNYSAGAKAFSFKWWSLRSIFALTLIGFSLIELVTVSRQFIRLGFSLGGVTGIFFYLSTTSTAVLMFYLGVSGRWIRLMSHFERTDKIFDDKYPVPARGTLRRKVIVLTVFFSVAAVVEHMFYLLAKMTNVISQIRKCKFKIFFYEHFLRTERKHIYAVIPFNYYMAIPFEITNICNTFAWTFLDLFIMIYSIALAHRFDQISRRIRTILLQVINLTTCDKSPFNPL